MSEMLSEITPLILTFNEGPNIRRTLDRLLWARAIVVVDSFSTDETIDIVRSYPSVHVLQRTFDTFAGQCNFGLEHVQSPWVLSMDADYVLSDDLLRELELLKPRREVAAYRTSFKYCIAGRPLRAALYPPRTVLYRRHLARYRDEGHGHRVQIDGLVEGLRGSIHHDDRKPFDRWLSEQNRYMVAEARHLLGESVASLTLQDRLRRWIFVAPPLVFLYTLFGKGLILDGWRGWVYVCQRTIAECILALRLAESRIHRNDES